MIEPDSAESWVFYADNSYIVTRLLWFTGFSMEPPVSAHRTIELFLKAYLVSKRDVVQKGQPAWGHEISKLLTRCATYDEAFSVTPLTRRVGFFQRYFDVVRYPTSIEGKLKNGSLIWFGPDSSILPLDEVIAFLRPRIVLPDSAWQKSQLTFIYCSTDPRWEFQKRALIDSNKHIEKLVCSMTNSSEIKFDESFNVDLPGC